MYGHIIAPLGKNLENFHEIISHIAMARFWIHKNSIFLRR